MPDQMRIQSFIARELARERHAEPGRITRHGWKAYSQNDEDGLIQEIFRRIGTTDRSFVEFGVENGRQCNSLWLVMNGWRGLWIEADATACASIRETHAAYLDSGALALTEAFITRDNINALIAARFSGEIDLLSIDLDSNDYWVWEAIGTVNPRVVVVEYNAAWPPPASLTVPYDESGGWDGTNRFGASLSALTGLGQRKGYDLVGCCLAGVNAFFVRRDLTGNHFFRPGSDAAHYEPARYFLSAQAAGHPPGVGPVVAVEPPSPA